MFKENPHSSLFYVCINERKRSNSEGTTEVCEIDSERNSEAVNQNSKTSCSEPKDSESEIEKSKNLNTLKLINSNIQILKHPKPMISNQNKTLEKIKSNQRLEIHSKSCIDYQSNPKAQKQWTKKTIFQRPNFQRKFYTSPHSFTKIQARTKNFRTNQHGPRREWVPKCEILYHSDLSCRKESFSTDKWKQVISKGRKAYVPKHYFTSDYAELKKDNDYWNEYHIECGDYYYND